VPEQPGIVFEHVSKTFPDGTAALESIDLSVDPDEFVAIVGPSGCGKTTLLRLAAGLLLPTHGTVHAADRNIGYVFQDPTLLPWRTVLRNVELLGELHRVAPDIRRQTARRAIEKVGLQGEEAKFPKALSGGMRMRVSLARALTMQPSVFLFDEPFGALDEITRQRLNDELLELFAAAPFAGLFVTHSVAEAVFIGTRVVVLSARPGRIVVDRRIDLPAPRERFSAEFAAVCGEVSRALREAS
jgi:NitT/TauT family transport system ATP-binding protein